jgi:hypothetical protein
MSLNAEEKAMNRTKFRKALLLAPFGLMMLAPTWGCGGAASTPEGGNGEEIAAGNAVTEQGNPPEQAKPADQAKPEEHVGQTQQQVIGYPGSYGGYGAYGGYGYGYPGYGYGYAYPAYGAYGYGYPGYGYGAYGGLGYSTGYSRGYSTGYGYGYGTACVNAMCY